MVGMILPVCRAFSSDFSLVWCEPQVYQFYHMIGKPLGDYDTTKNYGRYLCVREELRRQMNEPEEVQHSWFYKNVYVWIVETHQRGSSCL
jgi:hypothetical protein